MDNQLRSKTAALQQITAHYVEAAGPAPTILFLHGVTDSLDSYRGVLEILAGKHKLVALDLRGHGLSARASSYRIRDHASDVAQFIRDYTEGPIIVAGHSLGALTTLCLAAGAPDLVSAIFLEDPPVYSAQIPALLQTPDFARFRTLRSRLAEHQQASGGVAALEKWVGDEPIHPALFEGKSLLEVAGPDAVTARATSLHRLDVGTLDAVLDGSQFDAFDPEEALRAIACPIHVLAGDVSAGGALARDQLDRMVAIGGTCTGNRLSGVGHLIHHTAPLEYLAELRQLIERAA